MSYKPLNPSLGLFIKSLFICSHALMLSSCFSPATTKTSSTSGAVSKSTVVNNSNNQNPQTPAQDLWINPGYAEITEGSSVTFTLTGGTTPYKAALVTSQSGITLTQISANQWKLSTQGMSKLTSFFTVQIRFEDLNQTDQLIEVDVLPKISPTPTATATATPSPTPTPTQTPSPTATLTLDPVQIELFAGDSIEVSVSGGDGVYTVLPSGFAIPKPGATVGTFIVTAPQTLGDHSIRFNDRAGAQATLPLRVSTATRNIPNELASPRSGNIQLWGLTQQNDVDIDAPEAWTKATSCGVNTWTAIVDTGIDLNHVDLRNNLADLSPFPLIQMNNHSGGTITSGSRGINLADPTSSNGSNVQDANGHGTEVAGIIGASANNISSGLAAESVGVCWSARMIGVKVLDADGEGYVSDTVAGVKYLSSLARSLPANDRIIANHSYGLPGAWSDLSSGSIRSLYDAFAEAQQNNIFSAVASGNADTNQTAPDISINPGWPASFPLPSVINVAALEKLSSSPFQKIADFSYYGTADRIPFASGLPPDPTSANYRRGVDLAAPGVDVLTSRLNGGGLAIGDGTSFSAPFVAGAASLINSFERQSGRSPIPYYKLRKCLMKTAERSTSLNKVINGNRLSIAKALMNCRYYR